MSKIIFFFVIKNYNEADQGLYECTAENDLRVSKIVYNLKDNFDLMNKKPLVLVPIGSTNNFREKISKTSQDQGFDSNDFGFSEKNEPKINKQFRTKSGNVHHSHHHQYKNENDETASSSILSKKFLLFIMEIAIFFIF